MAKIRNWSKFQHFKDRRPPWIKLYRDLLDDKDWSKLDGDSAKFLVMIWLLASENCGEVPDVEEIAFRLRASESDVKARLNKISKWLDHVDITAISSEYQGDTVADIGNSVADIETHRRDREETETEKDIEPTALVVSPTEVVETDLTGQVVKLPDRRIPCPADRLLEVFHAECPTLPSVIKVNDKRRQHLTARWREVDAESKFSSSDDGIEIFRAVFKKVNASDFLSGRSQSNGRRWKASFDWIFESSTNFLKVCEGHYDNEQNRRVM